MFKQKETLVASGESKKMKIFSTHQSHAAQNLRGPHGPNSPTATGPTSNVQKTDQLEISSEALEAAKLAEAAEARALESLKPADGSIRSDLVARLRQEIAGGTYETADKIDAALDRLLDELG